MSAAQLGNGTAPVSVMALVDAYVVVNVEARSRPAGYDLLRRITAARKAIEDAIATSAPPPVEAGEPAPPTLICPRCKVDRFKQPCGDPYHPPCAMTAIAATHPKEPTEAREASAEALPEVNEALRFAQELGFHDTISALRSLERRMTAGVALDAPTAQVVAIDTGEEF